MGYHVDGFHRLTTFKTNTCMPQRKYARNVRLRNLRGVLNITQAELGKLSGYSEPYILAVEIGQRNLSLRLARKISNATGAGLSWVLGMEGNDAQPLLETGMLLQRDRFQQKRRSVLTAAHKPSTDEMSDIHQLCLELSQLMLAVCRKGQLVAGKYLFRQMVSTIESELRLKSRVDLQSEAEREQLHLLLEYLFAHESDRPVYKGTLGRVQREALWQLVSPSAARYWAKLFATNTNPERSKFRQVLSKMTDLLNESLRSGSNRDTRSIKQRH
jgi:transcriptional regulator with XRE-family HTH domain